MPNDNNQFEADKAKRSDVFEKQIGNAATVVNKSALNVSLTKDMMLLVSADGKRFYVRAMTDDARNALDSVNPRGARMSSERGYDYVTIIASKMEKPSDFRKTQTEKDLAIKYFSNATPKGHGLSDDEYEQFMALKEERMSQTEKERLEAWQRTGVMPVDYSKRAKNDRPINYTEFIKNATNYNDNENAIQLSNDPPRKSRTQIEIEEPQFAPQEKVTPLLLGADEEYERANWWAMKRTGQPLKPFKEPLFQKYSSSTKAIQLPGKIYSPSDISNDPVFNQDISWEYVYRNKNRAATAKIRSPGGMFRYLQGFIQNSDKNYKAYVGVSDKMSIGAFKKVVEDPLINLEEMLGSGARRRDLSELAPFLKMVSAETNAAFSLTETSQAYEDEMLKSGAFYRNKEGKIRYTEYKDTKRTFLGEIGSAEYEKQRQGHVIYSNEKTLLDMQERNYLKHGSEFALEKWKYKGKNKYTGKNIWQGSGDPTLAMDSLSLSKEEREWRVERIAILEERMKKAESFLAALDIDPQTAIQGLEIIPDPSAMDDIGLTNRAAKRKKGILYMSNFPDKYETEYFTKDKPMWTGTFKDLLMDTEQKVLGRRVGESDFEHQQRIEKKGSRFAIHPDIEEFMGRTGGYARNLSMDELDVVARMAGVRPDWKILSDVPKATDVDNKNQRKQAKEYNQLISGVFGTATNLQKREAVKDYEGKDPHELFPMGKGRIAHALSKAAARRTPEEQFIIDKEFKRDKYANRLGYIERRLYISGMDDNDDDFDNAEVDKYERKSRANTEVLRNISFNPDVMDVSGKVYLDEDFATDIAKNVTEKQAIDLVPIPSSEPEPEHINAPPKKETELAFTPSDDTLLERVTALEQTVRELAQLVNDFIANQLRVNGL